jgi:hypothetical protein
VIGGMQLILSNGKMSPLYLTKESSDKNFERVEVDFTKVKRLRGTSNSFWLSQLHFIDEDNKELNKLASF